MRRLPCRAGQPHRFGHAQLTAVKGLQEIILLLVFALLSWGVLGQAVTQRQALGFALIVVAAVLIIWDTAVTPH